MNLRNLLSALSCFILALCFSHNTWAQCTDNPATQLTPPPGTCVQAQSSANIVPFFGKCGDICANNSTTGASGEVTDHSCTGGKTPAHDLFLYADNPYSQVPNYDGSLVFRWVSWPNMGTVPPPYLSVEGNVAANLDGISVKTTDCSGSPAFALQNAICVDTPVGNQFYAPAGTIPTLSQLTPIVDQIAGVNVTLTDVAFWIYIATQDNATGNICFEVSQYQSGFLCGDPNTINLAGSATSVSGSAPAECLCSNALYGGIGEPANASPNLPIPCGQESQASAWYKVVAPFNCNRITASLGSWGGNDSYNIVILAGVNCPGKNETNPITGSPVFLPGQELQSGATEVASACGGPASNNCAPVPAGEYYIVVSGKSERPTFQLNVTIDEVGPTIGTASSPENNKNVCSGSPVTVNSSGNVLPLSSCGQTVLWYYSTSSNFNPYTGGGTYAASDTSNVMINLPANTSCAPLTYYIKGVISDNGTTAVAACKGTTNLITVTVYPEIGNVIVDNTQCLISVAGRCSSFTVNGKTSVDNFVATFADNGTTRQFVISNGLAGCDTSISETVSCSGNCTQPTVTANATCDSLDPYNFYVGITFAPGSAASYYVVDDLGGTFPLNGAGNYTVGPYPNGTTVSLSVDNPTDSACNLPLGTFTNSCNTVNCPNLTSASVNISGNICEGQQTILSATVDHGVLGMDYTIQWYVNGTPVPNGTFLNVSYTFTTSQGCSPEAQEFTVSINCLDAGANPPTNTSLTAGTLIVYPKPKLGVDFTQNPAGCTVAPVDLCGGLVISTSPNSNPSPGTNSETVNYTVSVPSAPNGCAATGSYVINCNASSCSNTAGSALGGGTYCFGEQYNISSQGSTTGTGGSFSPGFTQSWAVTNVDPSTDLIAAVNNAITTGQTFGDSSGTSNYTFTSGTTYGPGTYWFIPFIAMQSISSSSFTLSGSFSMSSPLPPFIEASGSGTITIPTLPYCSGTTAFNFSLSADKSSGSILATEVINSASSNIPGLSYNGGETNSIGPIPVNNYSGNPSGQQVVVNASTYTDATVSYSLTISYANSVKYPFVCPSCNSIGTPTEVVLLPQIQLTAPQPSPVCVNTSVNLTTYNPAVTNNYAGTYSWYDGDPNSGGQLITDPTNVTPTNGQSYFVTFEPTIDTLCTASTSITFTIQSPPTLNPIPAQPAACYGTPIDLTQLQPAVTTSAGTFVWYKGSPDSNGVRLPEAFAQKLVPIEGQLYYVVFTDYSTGCSNSESTSFNVLPQPPLNGLPPEYICGGGSVNLTSLDAGITTDTGTFAWYSGNPLSGGTLLTMAQDTAVQPTKDTVYYVLFTDSASGCSAVGNAQIDISPAPVLVAPSPTKVCSDTILDLTTFQSGITSTPGYFTWYAGLDSSQGGTPIPPSQVQSYLLDSTTVFYVHFVNAVTGCSNSTSFTFATTTSPVLNTLPQEVVCVGQTASLNSLDTSLTYANGFFNWYIGDPKAGGTLLTPTQADNQLPNDNIIYYVQFVSFPSGCSAIESFSYIVNPGPSLNPIPYPGTLCINQSVDLTSYDTAVTAARGTFSWYSGDPALGGTLITGNQLDTLVPSTSATYYLVFTDTTGCTGKESISFQVYSAITGANVSYNCNANDLAVSLSGASGGAGSGYIVAANSPDTAGQVLANGANWTVLITDSSGCLDTVTGSVNCVIEHCSGGTAAAVNTVICCGDSIVATVTGQSVSPGDIIAWALTPYASGPVNSIASVQAAQAAGNVFKGDSATGSLTFTTNCNTETPGNDYYLTPFIAEAAVVDSIIWDTTKDCVPTIEVCPTISGSNWVVDSLVIVFPNGVSYNVNKEKFGGIPLTPSLLAAIGKIPCFNLASLYKGDPNGTWSVVVYNSGTGAVSFTLPAFQIIVSGDSGCTILGPGNNQITNIDSVTGTIAGGSNQSISLVIPPLPANFPTIDTTCEGWGTPITIHVKPADSCSVGINTINDLAGITIYPNPTENSFTIDGYLQSAGDMTITILDMVGTEVQRVEQKMETGRFKQQIDLSLAAQGVYFVNIKTQNQTVTKRIAKQ